MATYWDNVNQLIEDVAARKGITIEEAREIVVSQAVKLVHALKAERVLSAETAPSSRPGARLDCVG